MSCQQDNCGNEQQVDCIVKVFREQNASKRMKKIPWHGSTLNLATGKSEKVVLTMHAIFLLTSNTFSPKTDSRFGDQRREIAANKHVDATADAEEDHRTADEFHRYWDAFDSLCPETVEAASKALLPFVKPERVERMDKVLSQRTQHCRFLFENPMNPSNVWACLRTIDSFGIQNVDVVIQSGKYSGKTALVQKRGMRTAMGSARWLTIRNYLSTTEAANILKGKGYKIVASDLNPDSKDIRDIDWDNDGKPICIVMGNENRGISQEMRELADETFTLPMVGFAESFNLSVATAITLAHLSASSKDGMGPLRPGDMDENEIKRLRLKGIINSLAHKKTAKAILNREGVELPEELGWV